MAKIAIIHHSGIIGGAGVSLLNIIDALSTEHEITVYVSESPTDMINKLKLISNECNINIISYGNRIGALTFYNGGDSILSLRFFYRLFLIFRQRRYWNRELKRLNPNVVIVNSIILSWMSLLKEVKKRKSICFVRETIYGGLNLFFNKIERKLLNKFSKVVFLTQFDSNSWDLKCNKPYIIPDVINYKEFNNKISRTNASNEYGLKKDSFHVLYVGGISYMKGCDIITNAVLELNNTINVELIIAGVDFKDRFEMGNGKLSDFEENLKLTIENHIYGTKIHVIGRQQNMSYAYSCADVLVFPMRSAHQARPVFEAGHYSIPVIISDFPHIKENVVNMVNGLVFKPENVKDLIKKIKTLALNNELRLSLGRNNHEMTTNKHSMKLNATLTNNMIKEIL